jgi:hypothetical protein
LKSPRIDVVAHRGKDPAFSGYVGQQLIGSAGIRTIWSGLGECWLELEPLGREHYHGWYRLMKRYLSIARRSGKYRRIIADCIDRREDRRLIESLGFSFESTMPQHGPHGETFCRYVMYQEEAWTS